MTNRVNAIIGCSLVGEYVDEGECPTTLTARGGEVVRPQVVANFVDDSGNDDGLREFTVLLKDGRVVAVRGHSLKHLAHTIPGEDTYSVVVRTGGEEVLVALFKSADVAGVFHGEVHWDRKSA